MSGHETSGRGWHPRRGKQKECAVGGRVMCKMIEALEACFAGERCWEVLILAALILGHRPPLGRGKRTGRASIYRQDRGELGRERTAVHR